MVRRILTDKVKQDEHIQETSGDPKERAMTKENR
jgi:hypothetical protein